MTAAPGAEAHGPAGGVPEGMLDEFIDAFLFHPRRDSSDGWRQRGVSVVRLLVEAGVMLTGRLHATPGVRPLVTLFHGNGEVASDYDDLAPLFAMAGANLLVVDYRGYGASQGVSTASNLLADAHAVLASLPLALVGRADASAPLIVLGRSLGSAPAIELAAACPSQVCGLIIDSGFADTATLLARLGRRPLPDDIAKIGEGFGNARKMGKVTCPTLIVHGGRDTLIPPSDAYALYDACAARSKRLVVIPHAGHNDLLVHGERAYTEAISALIRSAAR